MQSWKTLSYRVSYVKFDQFDWEAEAGADGVFWESTLQEKIFSAFEACAENILCLLFLNEQKH